MLNRTSSSLLVLILSSAALGKSLPTVNETLDVYEAEENSNVTLKWIRPDPNATPPDRLYVDLMSMEPLRRIYRFDSRDETYTDDEFKGRLHCDPKLVRNGGIRCLLAEVRLSDAGRYRCYVVIDGRRDHRDWELVVRASIPQTQEETQELVDRGRFGLYVGLGLFLLAAGRLALHSAAGSGFRFSSSNSRT
ncbi:uncharacterized protein LOC129356120 isoform X2 [Poeciliopsis prolifica]|nr:uncharacterized protein LOC129356120 isoform X2 [Poeciliopsis prolifica]